MKKICEIANQSVPTKIITDVSFTTKNNDSLTGYYVTTTDGTNMIFDYTYERFATPQESLELGNSDRIIVSKGVVNYKDGVYFSGEGDEWRPGTGTAFDLKFNINKDFFENATTEADGTVLKATVSKEVLTEIVGTDLNAVGDAEITLTTNGYNLTMVSIVCSTENGTLSIRTSYTYNRQNLFPESEETETT